ncbi:hypothetical protein GCM10017673_40140 [Streptosporangium violaceochromogenes]|nr:hypothetical protein GCM10017673_40140 [Streptosporangium violaceochromogenes]
MTNILLATLALGGLGLDITRQVLHAVGECRPDWDDPILVGRLTHALNVEAERLAAGGAP